MKNILFITTDEQHRNTISALGASTHSTPVMDRLINEGTFYENAYSASPVCLPSRCTMMTGMMPHVSGSISNIFGASLSPEHPNLFKELKKKGYTTSLHGKCHFIPVPYPATRPDMTLEYEHFITYYRSLGMDRLDLQDDKNNSLWYFDDYSKELACKGLLTKYRDEAHMTPANRCKFDFPHDASIHPDHWVGDKAAEHIKSLDPDDKAFVWVSFSGPHYPVDTPRKYIDMVDMSKDTGRVFREGEWERGDKYHANGYFGPGTTEGSSHADHNAQKNYSEDYWTDWRRRYFGNVVLIDEMMGNVIKAAEEKWGDDFVVIFTADHGEMMGNHSLWGKNGSLYEDVLRVPLAVWEPSGKHERVSKTVVSTDLYPTILKYAGIRGTHALCDGVPLDEDEGRDYVISECDNRVAVIKDCIKLEWNRYPRTGRIYKELYDLEKDPDEFENEYFNPEYAEKIKELEAILEEKEEKEHLLSTVFFDNGERPYYADFGSGAGYLCNGGMN